MKIGQGLVVDAAFVPEIRRYFGASLEIINADEWVRAMDCVEKSEMNPESERLTTIPVIAAMGRDCHPDCGLLGSRCDSFRIPFAIFTEGECSQAFEWVIGIVLKKAEADRVAAAGARRSASILRQELDSQRRAFEDLADAASSGLIPIRTLVLDWGSSYETLGTRDALSGTGRGSIVQPLPISPRAISAIDLHVMNIGSCSGRDTSISLELRDLTGRILSESLPTDIAEIFPGWIRFPFSNSADCMHQAALLFVHLDGGRAIEFSLSFPQSVGEYRPVATDGAVLAESGLALKVWRGYVGATPRGFIGKKDGKSVRLKYPSQFQRAELYHNYGERMNFKAVDFWKKKDAFLVHPPKSGMMIAIVRSIPLSGVVAITLLVNNNHRKGPVISFAIGIVPKGEAPDSGKDLGRWLSLPPLEWGEVHTSFSEPLNGEFDLVLASMVASGEGNEKAWALFRGFVFHSEEIL